MEVLSHPEHTASFNNRIVVAIGILALEKLETDRVVLCRLAHDDCCHVARLTGEAEYIAWLELHVDALLRCS